MSSDNRISNEKPTIVPRLSLRITRNPNINSNTDNNLRNSGVSFREGELMSPRTTSVSLSSSSSKEVPRAALNSPPSTSDFTEIMTIDGINTGLHTIESQLNHQNLIEDSIQGLEALAASAVAASLPENNANINERRVSISSEEESIESIEFNEDEILGNIFNTSLDEKFLSNFYREHCLEEFLIEAKDKLMGIIEKSDELLKSKSISMSLKNIFPLFIERIIQQEVKRTGRKDFTKLLMDQDFLSSSATVILMLPRLISILFQIEEVSTALNSNLFDVLLSIEQVLKAIPELQKLPSTLKRLQQLQNILLEDSVWKLDERTGKENILLKMIRAEFDEIKKLRETSCPLPISTTLTGIRSSQRALETLSGFPVKGVRLTRLELFFRKYLRLAAQRLQYATLRLGLSQCVTQLSWEFFFELVQRNDAEEDDDDNFLFKNRHLNQILLSIIYCTSHLLEDDRTFQQISQVLPSVQSQSTWLNEFNSDDTNDFYTFYNEKFIPPLRNKIEKFLKKRESTESLDSWILNGLFNTAPFPINQFYHVTPNITLNRLNQPKLQSTTISTDKFEWINPIENNSNSKIQIPQTPSNTSQLFNWPTSPTTPQKRHTFSIDSDDFRIKKVARRLDFSE